MMNYVINLCIAVLTHQTVRFFTVKQPYLCVNVSTITVPLSGCQKMMLLKLSEGRNTLLM